MLHIAICDDSPQYLELIYSLTETFCSRQGVLHQIDTFDDGANLLQAMDPDYDIAILDVKMRILDGIQTAQVLRQRKRNTIIIYVSEYLEFAIQGYEVNAFRYLLKKDIEQDFPVCINSAFLQWKHFQQTYTYSRRGVTTEVYMDSILYFESRKREVYFFLVNGEYLMHYAKMNDVETAISDRYFVRCHQSYLVNLTHIVNLDYSKVYMKNGAALPISDSRRAEFKRRYLLYKSEMR